MTLGSPDANPSQNPWLSIWWKPQATVTAVLQRGGRTHTLLLATIAGIGLMIDTIHPIFHWFSAIVAAVLLGPALGIFGLYVYGALLAWTGRPLGGHGSQSALRTALAWAAMPNVTAALILVAALALFRQDFLRAYASTTYAGDLVFDAIMVITVVLALWALVLSVRAIGAVQDFSLWRSLANLGAAVLVVFAVWIPLRMFFYQPFVTTSRSMEPALEIGDFFFVEKWRYGWSRYGFGMPPGSAVPERGDLVVYARKAGETEQDFVKRIIGLPGDEIRIDGGQLVINGTPVSRRFLYDIEGKDDIGFDEKLDVHEEVLPDGPTITVFNRKTGSLFDTVAAVRVEPGHYFVIGDNRDRSLDSRSADHGLVPFRDIVGRVGVIYLSAQKPSDTDTIAGASGNIRWIACFAYRNDDEPRGAPLDAPKSSHSSC